MADLVLLLCGGCLPKGGIEVLTSKGHIGPETRVCQLCGEVPEQTLEQVSLRTLLRDASQLRRLYRVARSDVRLAEMIGVAGG